MCVITYTSSLTETIIDAVSTLFVWILMLISYKIGLPYGEPWNMYSFIELSGFLLLVTGNLIYNGQLKIPSIKCQKRNEENLLLVDNLTTQYSISTSNSLNNINNYS